MQLMRDLHTRSPCQRGCVATIGNFDGMHKGHQMILTALKAQAKKMNLPSVVVLFEPQPTEFFNADRPPVRLMRFREKIAYLKAYDIDRVLCLRFNQLLSVYSSDQFIDKILIKTLNTKWIIIGDDFHFGYQRQGNFNTLKTVGMCHGFDVATLPTQTDAEQKRISSTKVRNLLKAGQITAVKAALGRPYSMSARVIKGQQRGRTIGVPTANMALKRACPPIVGVYAVKITGLDKPYNGVANVGYRPTVDGQDYLLEVHIFNFNQDIYGEHLTVHFIEKIRDEKKFDSFEALKTQIWQDIATARIQLTHNLEIERHD